MMIRMTLKRFQQLLKEVNPKLKLKIRGYGDIVGLYGGYHYICRMTKGELCVNGYRIMVQDPNNPLGMKQGIIKKRGRKTIVNILHKNGWIKGYKQRSKLLWGLK